MALRVVAHHSQHLGCDWLDAIPLYCHLVFQFQDPQSLVKRQIYDNIAICTSLSKYVGLQMKCTQC